MADGLMRMRACRRFPLTPKRKLVIGETFHVSAQLAERLVRRGDAEADPEPVKPRRKGGKARASADVVSEDEVNKTMGAELGP